MIRARGKVALMADEILSNEEIDASVLYSIKKTLGINPQDTSFDVDLLLFVNSVFSELCQLGVGPSEAFSIRDESANWEDFVSDSDIAMVKAYVLLDVKLMFDPPTSSTVLSAMEKKRDEYEWRLNVAGDNKLYYVEEAE